MNIEDLVDSITIPIGKRVNPKFKKVKEILQSCQKKEEKQKKANLVTK